MVQFCEYLTLTWFDEDCLFPIDLWNHYKNRGPRTNNHIEGYNLKLKMYLNSHPNIWKFIIKIREEESNYALNFTHLTKGTLKQKERNRKIIEKDIKILDLKNELFLKDINIKEYILNQSESCRDYSK